MYMTMELTKLLKSSLLCGLKPEGKPIHRLQLFFIANKEQDIGERKSHENAFQKALENGIYKNKYWEFCPEKVPEIKGSGEFKITQNGYEEAIRLFPNIKPKYPIKSKDDLEFSYEGYIEQIKVFIRKRGSKTDIFIDNIQYNNGKEAGLQLEKRLGCRILKKGGNAIRDLSDLVIDYDLEMNWIF